MNRVVVLRLLAGALALAGFLASPTTSPRSWLDTTLFDLLSPRASRVSMVEGIAITPEDLRALPQFGVSPGKWPWKRIAHGAVAHALQKQGARSIAFALFFEQAGDLLSDQVLERELKSSRVPTFLAAYQTSSVQIPAENDPPGLDLGLKAAQAQGLRLQEQGILHPPLPALTRAAGGIGLVNLPPEGLTATRGVPLVYRSGGRLLPSLALAACLGGELSPSRLHWEPGPTLVTPEFRLPLTPQGEGLLRLTPVPRRSVSDLLSIFSRSLGPNPDFQHRIFFVGLEGTALGAQHEVPGENTLASYQVQAAAARAILEDRVLRILSPFEGTGLLLVFLALPACLGLLRSGTPLSDLLFSLLLQGLVVMILLWTGLYPAPTRLLLAVLFGTGLPAGWLHLQIQEARKRREEEMRRAEEIAQGLLPGDLPEGVRGMLQPARIAAGDYYDGAILPDGTRIALVADVSGKGLDAALLAGQLRAAFRAFYSQAPDPARLLERLNAFLYQDLERSGRLVTAIVVAVRSDGRLLAAAAGHPPALIVGPTKLLRRVQARGKPLGYAPETKYRQLEDQLTDGEWALLLSDGVLEEPPSPSGRPPGLAAIESRLQELMQEALPTPSNLAECLLSRGPPRDDQTLVMIRALKT